MKRQTPEPLAVIHLGKFEDGMIIDDKCPFCDWDPPAFEKADDYGLAPTSQRHLLGQMWKPGAERGAGRFFQIYHCQACGTVYATHLN
jgi:hypothetical protein